MASTPPFQQYLSPTDMTMLDRVFKEVCVRSSIADGSPDAERVAALLIREFQHGANTEANLMTAYDGDVDFKLRVPVSRLSRLMGNALYGWRGTAERSQAFLRARDLFHEVFRSSANRAGRLAPDVFSRLHSG